MSRNDPGAPVIAGHTHAQVSIGLEDWDWEPGSRVIYDFSTADASEVPPASDIRISQDGEHLAWLTATEEGEFCPCLDGTAWAQSYDNAWGLRFTPDNRLLALVSSMGSWTLALDEEAWPEEYEYIWSPLISRSGETISAAVKKEGQYGMAVNGADWPVVYANATDFTQTDAGDRRAAVVQTAPLDEGDIATFRKGIYSVSIDGQTWKRTFVNVWSPCCREDGPGVAASVRVSPDEYTIAVDGECWPQTYGNVWEPCFQPGRGAVVAPVRIGSRWGLARDGELLWPATYYQLWHQRALANGSMAAIVATSMGEFTVAVDNQPWQHTYPVLTDLVIHSEGRRAAAVGQRGLTLSYDESQLGSQQWQVIVNDRPWSGWYDRVFTPVISPDGAHVAARVEQNGFWTVLVDDRVASRGFSRLWDPLFSPDGTKLLIKGLVEDQALRIVVELRDLGL